MRRLSFFLTFLALSSMIAVAQDSTSNPVQDLLDERLPFYQAYTDARAGFDTTPENLVMLAGKMEQVIKIDDIIIDKHLFAAIDRADELEAKLDEAEQSSLKTAADQAEQGLYFLIAAGAAGLFFLLFIIMLIMTVLRGGKNKKLKKTVAARDAEVAEEKANIQEEMQKTVNEMAGLKKELETTKATLEQDRKTFRNKEADYLSQVNLIEEKIKKSALKESDLNYQVFQLELRIKNELEGAVSEKCRLENKVVELERDLSETRLRLQEAAAVPVADEQEVKVLKEKVAWLEGEVNYFRPLSESEKQKRESAEQALQQKQSELDGLFRERDELWNRINQSEGRVNDMQAHINHLDGVITGLNHEKGQLEEQMRSRGGEGANESEGLHQRIQDLERMLNEAREEKERLNAQIDELLKFVDRFRHGQ